MEHNARYTKGLILLNALETIKGEDEASAFLLSFKFPSAGKYSQDIHSDTAPKVLKEFFPKCD